MGAGKDLRAEAVGWMSLFLLEEAAVGGCLKVAAEVGVFVGKVVVEAADGGMRCVEKVVEEAGGGLEGDFADGVGMGVGVGVDAKLDSNGFDDAG